MLELTVRLVVSLAIVVGLLLLIARIGGRKFQGRADAPVRVVHRQPLSRTSAVALVEVGGRVLVLGTTEHQVTVLTELDRDALDPALLAAPAAPAAATAPAEEELEIGAATMSFASALAAARTPAPAAPAPAPAAPPVLTAVPTPQALPAQATGPLAGSVLSVQTWKQALAAATRRAS